MFNAIFSLIAAIGLSISAGLNAYLPLLVVAITARMFPDLVKLDSPYDALASGWILVLLVVLFIIEFVVDKIPGINHINDFIQTVIRPASGAILFAASTSSIDRIDTLVAVILGLLLAGSVHAAKSAVMRPAVSATTGGVLNPVISVIEDIVAAVLSILAILLPWGMALLMLLGMVWMVQWLWRWWRRRQQPDLPTIV